MADGTRCRVSVCYAQPEDVFLVTLDVPAGSTLTEVVTASGVLARYPTLDLSRNKLGIFGKLRPADTAVRDGDRVEIYRPLQADPMESRRRRARHKAAAGK